jgi:hypothetical protein
MIVNDRQAGRHIVIWVETCYFAVIEGLGDGAERLR